MVAKTSKRVNAPKARRERTETLQRKAAFLSKIMQDNAPFTGHVATLVETDIGHWEIFLCTKDKSKYPIDFRAGTFPLDVDSRLRRPQKMKKVDFKFSEDFRTESEANRDRDRQLDPSAGRIELLQTAFDEEAETSSPDGSVVTKDSSQQLSSVVAVVDPVERSIASTNHSEEHVPDEESSTQADLRQDTNVLNDLTSHVETNANEIHCSEHDSHLNSTETETQHYNGEVPAPCQNDDLEIGLEHQKLSLPATPDLECSAITTTPPRSDGENTMSFAQHLSALGMQSNEAITPQFDRISTDDPCDWNHAESLPEVLLAAPMPLRKLRSGKVWRLAPQRSFNKRRHVSRRADF